MSIDARAFRDTVGQFVTGVTVIATDMDGTIRAMTANAFTSLSLDPPLVLVCVGKTAHLSAFIRSASGFSVNILAQTQRDLSTYFAGRWKQAEPPAFSFAGWEGGPLLGGCAAALGCAVDTIHEGGETSKSGNQNKLSVTTVSCPCSGLTVATMPNCARTIVSEGRKIIRSLFGMPASKTPIMPSCVIGGNIMLRFFWGIGREKPN